MDTGDWFWIGMFFWAVVGAGWGWRVDGKWGPVFGGNLLLFILIAFLGWDAFGGPFQG